MPLSLNFFLELFVPYFVQQAHSFFVVVVSMPHDMDTRSYYLEKQEKVLGSRLVFITCPLLHIAGWMEGLGPIQVLLL